MDSRNTPGVSRDKSKFEGHGALVYESLLNLRNNGGSTTRIHEQQIEAVLKTKKKIASNAFKIEPAPVLIVAPPGSGRSGIMVLLSYALEAKKVLVITPGDRSARIGTAFGSAGVESSFLQKSGFITEKETVEKMLEPGWIVTFSRIKNVERVNNLVIVRANILRNNTLEFWRHEVTRSAKELFQQFDLLLVDEADRYQDITCNGGTCKRIVDEFGVSLERKVVLLTTTSRTEFGLPILASQHVAHVILRKDIEGFRIRPCDFEELELPKYDEDAWIDNLKTVLARHQLEEDRFQHQALVLVESKHQVDLFVDKLNFDNDDYAVNVGGMKLLDFRAGKYRVGVTNASFPEGFVSTAVSVCVILRKDSWPRGFSQFVDHCLRMVEFAEGQPKDRTRACVLSYKEFEQRQMWNEWEADGGRCHLEVDSGDQDSDEEEVPPKRKSDDDQPLVVKRGRVIDENDDEGASAMELESNESVVARKREEPRIFTNALAILLKIPGMTEENMCMCSKLKLLGPDDDDYDDIVKYIDNGKEYVFGIKLLNILRVTRTNDPDFDEDPQLRKTFRMMLWHGTEMKNIPSILQNGFQLPPDNGQIFGRGIYFADMIGKSCFFCNASRAGSKAYLLLCDVLLGNMYNARNPLRKLTQPPKHRRSKFDSVMCTGQYVPNRDENRRLHGDPDGSIIPCGLTMVNRKFPSYILDYNEYVVYDPRKIKIKYVVHVEFTSGNDSNS